MDRTFFINNLWRWKCGVEEQPLPIINTSPATYKELEESEWSPTFEKLMRDRLVVGAFRYGRLKAPGKPQYDRVASMQKRLGIYAQTGNLELLVDVANLCLCEFEEGTHPNRHLKVLDETERVGTNIK